jgi:iron complex outermembrane receptor protein
VGAELQQFNSPVRVFVNSAGVKGTELEYDDLSSATALTFAQLEWRFGGKLFATVGASANFLRYQFERTSVVPAVLQEREFAPRVFPRVALLAKLNAFNSLFVSASEGFSPPTLAEVRPSTGNFNDALNPERGVNYEAGWRLHWQGLRVELAGYQFRLRDAIVIQRAADGAEFFLNAGKTRQVGFEGTASWTVNRRGRTLERLQAAANVTLCKFRFDDYVQDGTDFSGNRLTGVAPGFVAVSTDLSFRHGVYINLTLQYSDHVPLNDANTVFASDYWLVGARAGYKTKLGSQPFDFFAGADNILNEPYSLGNDLNAIGGRYFNAAPLRNYYAGVKINLAR